MVANLEFSHCSLLTSSLFYVNIKSNNPNKNQKVYGAAHYRLIEASVRIDLQPLISWQNAEAFDSHFSQE